MPSLVIGDGLTLIVGDDLGLLFQSTDNSINCIHEVLTLHSLFLASSGDERRLIAHVGDVGSREARCLPRKLVDVNTSIGLDIAQVHEEYLFAVGELRQLDINLSVKSSCAQQRLIEDIGTVCCRQNDNATVAAKSVHLGKELVEGALALVVATHVGIATTGTSYSVDLIDENDARSFLLGLAEEVTDTARAYTDKHLDEVATRH